MQTDFLLRLRPDQETATARPCQAPEHPCVVGDVKLEHAAARQRTRLAGETHRHVPSGRLEEDSEADRLRSLLRQSGARNTEVWNRLVLHQPDILMPFRSIRAQLLGSECCL